MVDTEVLHTIGRSSRHHRRSARPDWSSATTPRSSMRSADLDARVVRSLPRAHGRRRTDSRPRSPTSRTTSRSAKLPAHDLRQLYAETDVVVVPLVEETDFQAGITTILEAMAMGKPSCARCTCGQDDTVVDGVDGIHVRARRRRRDCAPRSIGCSATPRWPDGSGRPPDAGASNTPTSTSTAAGWRAR